MAQTSTPPSVSVIIVNYNCHVWMTRCLESLRQQTIFDDMEIVLVDNSSKDGSDLLALELLKDWPCKNFVQTGTNLGFGGAANRGAAAAKGKYLFFLNPDVWLERDCLEQLLKTLEQNGEAAAGPLVLNYEDNTLQSKGVTGFDIFGLSVDSRPSQNPKHLFSAAAFYFIRIDVFQRIGGFDEQFFLYCEEMDLAWRIWVSGEVVCAVSAARVHHRGAALENAKGGTQIVETRTSYSKRFYTYRNHLLTLLKNCRHVLLLLLVSATGLIILEGLAGAALLRQWAFFSRTSWAAVVASWRLRSYVIAERRRIKSFRRRSDIGMMRFISWRLNRWHELKQIVRRGLPKVD